jgi:hypothetical protein
VGTLSRAALVEVIKQPARRAGLTFNPPTLPQTMAADAGGGDALPLLAYALQELSPCRNCASPRDREGCWPPMPTSASVGSRVLTRQADKVAAERGGVDPAGPVLSTLLKFVTLGENEPTRQRVRHSTLTGIQRQVAQAFIAARLLTSARRRRRHSRRDVGETRPDLGSSSAALTRQPLRCTSYWHSLVHLTAWMLP